MRKALFMLFVLLSLLGVNDLFSQHTPDKAGSLSGGKFVLKIDLNWDKQQQRKFAELYDLDSAFVRHLFQHDFSYFSGNDDWQLNVVGKDIVELSSKIEADNEGAARSKILAETYEVSEKTNGLEGSSVQPVASVFGANQFTFEQAFRYNKGRGCFFLLGYESARKITIAGSFNQWSTIASPMEFTGKGWFICIPLPPGKHAYKFIVDGRWLHDPANKNKERDGHNDYNSVIYCTNYEFRLNGFPKAGTVVLTGSFNNWNTKSLKMEKTSTGWSLPVYLREGTHTYKFIVDGKWINDPENELVRPDGNGNLNSSIGIGDVYVFKLEGHKEAQEVKLAGSFNSWNPNELIMEKTANGWVLPYHLAPGYYEYKFLVDGRWITDPGNKQTVGSGEFANSFLSFKPNYTFRFKASPDVKQVRLSGSFNNWSGEGYPMIKVDDEWQCSLYLQPGRYAYKLIVDGKWTLDEANPLWEENEVGTGNSVLWIE